MDWLSRTELLIGEEGVEKLRRARVLVIGLGGVGAMAAEMLCRAGIGSLHLVDGDVVNESNINRQILALSSTVGKAKTEVLKQRLLDINPLAEVHVFHEFLRDERMIELLDEGFDYVVDAIDTISPKVFLIYHSVKKNLRIVSSMGAGGKFDPTKIEIDDISKSNNCNLARLIRKRLHKLGLREGAKAVFSTEKVAKEAVLLEESTNKKSNVGTISFMPAAFGLACASVVINDLLRE